jgi:hypothetical protein
MTASERKELLARWVKPSSTDEVSRQERAVRMVRDAIDDSDELNSESRELYAKGSYANNTNVRIDSDVDIAIDCHRLFYWDYASYVTQPNPALPHTPYTGKWTPAAWRAAVVAALEAKFGKSDVDTTGSVAIKIKEIAGSRPSIDVVPGFHYKLYTEPDKSSWHDGSCVFPTSGKKIVNWPDQQLYNGRKKNDATGKRYKDFVRVLKNAENYLSDQKTIPDLASFLMECLVWNVDNDTLKLGDRDTAFRATLLELWEGLSDSDIYKKWVEPSRLKYMFRSDAKWTHDEAKSLVSETWDLLGYA